MPSIWNWKYDSDFVITILLLSLNVSHKVFTAVSSSLSHSLTHTVGLFLFRPALFHVIYLLNMFHFSIREWKAHTECGGKRFDYGQTIIAIAAKHCVNGFLYTQKMFDKRKRECGCCWRGSVLSNNALRYISASRYDIENEFGMFFHAWKLLWSIRLNFNIHTHQKWHTLRECAATFYWKLCIEIIQIINENWNRACIDLAFKYLFDVERASESEFCGIANGNAKPIPFSIVYMNECNQL